jgi:hypothetical protein
MTELASGFMSDPRYLVPEANWREAEEELARELANGQFGKVLELVKYVGDAPSDPNGPDKKAAALAAQDLYFATRGIVNAVRSLRIQVTQLGGASVEDGNKGATP